MTLVDSPAEIIRQLLIDLGLATAASTWPVFATGEPASPDNCITVTDTVGTSDGRSMIDGELYTHFGFQVRVRSTDHDTGWLKAAVIRTHLARSVYQRTVAMDIQRYFIQAITNIGQVLPLGKEVAVSKRSLFTVNATVPIRVLS